MSPAVYAVIVAGTAVQVAFEPVLVAMITAAGAVIAAWVTSRGVRADQRTNRRLARRLRRVAAELGIDEEEDLDDDAELAELARRFLVERGRRPRRPAP